MSDDVPAPEEEEELGLPPLGPLLRLTLAAFLIAALAFSLFVVILAHSHRGRRRTNCANEQRQIALAAVQYADDKRFLPHRGRTRELDGDELSADTPRSLRALVWYGDHDNPEGFVCPASDDAYVPIQNREVAENMRLWSWGGGDGGDPEVPPWRAGLDPALVDTPEVSFAYTRRGYNRNVSSVLFLLADRGVRAAQSAQRPGEVGNHPDGWNVAKADCSVEFIPSTYDFGAGRDAYAGLRSTGKGGGHLPISQVAKPGP